MAAVLRLAYALGFALPPIEELKRLNKKISAYKAAGIWAKLDTYYDFLTGEFSPDFMRIDLKRHVPGTILGGLIITDYGIEGNLIDGYFDTEFNPATEGVNYSQNNASKFAISYKETVTTTVIDCVIDGVENTRNAMYQNNNNLHRVNQGITTLNANVNFLGKGLKLASRYDSNNLLFVNKSNQYSRTAASEPVHNAKQGLLKRGVFYGDGGLSVYGMASSLTYAESQAMREIENESFTYKGLTAIA